jgi:hypothetical protein
VAWPPNLPPQAPNFSVFIDDAPNSEAVRDQRAGAIGFLASARARGQAIRILFDERAARAWIRRLPEEGFPTSAPPLRRIYLASGGSQASGHLARQVSLAVDLPLVEPEAEHPDHDYAGWGPRYEALAREERWLVHSPTWHAAEALGAAADLVILVEHPGANPKEFPSPRPDAGKWRRLFSPWLRRYPSVEAGLLGREVARHAGDTPLLRLRTEAEERALVEGLSVRAPIH